MKNCMKERKAEETVSFKWNLQIKKDCAEQETSNIGSMVRSHNLFMILNILRFEILYE